VNWKLIGPLVAGTIVVGAAAVYWIANRAAPPRYVTTAVTLGDVVTTITATGSVNPVVVVEVGSYVSGTIATLSCDYNNRVHKGQLCAKIDPKPYQIVVDQDKAELDVAKAQLVKDQANVVYTKTNHERLDLLFSQDSASHDAADTALDAYHQAVASGLTSLRSPRRPRRCRPLRPIWTTPTSSRQWTAENSYASALHPRDGAGPPRLVWHTEEEGKSIDYLREPARSAWQRFEVELMSWLSLDSGL